MLARVCRPVTTSARAPRSQTSASSGSVDLWLPRCSIAEVCVLLELNARRANTTTAQCSESRSNESHVLAGRPPHSARSHCSLAQRVTCWLVSVLGFSGSRGFLGCPVPLPSSVLGFSDSRGFLGCPVPLRSPHLRACATPPPPMAGACVLGCRSLLRSRVSLPLFCCFGVFVTHVACSARRVLVLYSHLSPMAHSVFFAPDASP